MQQPTLERMFNTDGAYHTLMKDFEALLSETTGGDRRVAEPNRRAHADNITHCTHSLQKTSHLNPSLSSSIDSGKDLGLERIKSNLSLPPLEGNMSPICGDYQRPKCSASLDRFAIGGSDGLRERMLKDREALDMERASRDAQREERRIRRELRKVPTIEIPQEPPAASSSEPIQQPPVLDLALFLELTSSETSGRDELTLRMDQVARRLRLDFNAEVEQLVIVEVAQNRLELRRVRQQFDDNARREGERDRSRRWEVVRDTTWDEEYSRREVEEKEAAVRVAVREQFSWEQDSCLFDVLAGERQGRATMAQEADRQRLVLIYSGVVDCEQKGRSLILDAAEMALYSDISRPMAQWQRSYKCASVEQTKRRTYWEEERCMRSVLKEHFTSSLMPILSRLLWRAEVRETELRLAVEGTEDERWRQVTEGCSNSRELVAVFGSRVRNARSEWKLHLTQCIRSLVEEEYATRLLVCRDSSEGWILLQETQRRDKDRADQLALSMRQLEVQKAIRAAQELQRPPPIVDVAVAKKKTAAGRKT